MDEASLEKILGYGIIGFPDINFKGSNWFHVPFLFHDMKEFSGQNDVVLRGSPLEKSTMDLKDEPTQERTQSVSDNFEEAFVENVTQGNRPEVFEAQKIVSFGHQYDDGSLI